MQSMPSTVPRHANPRDAESAEWVRDLRGFGHRHEVALGRLHSMLVRAASREAGRRAVGLPIAGAELADVAHQAADDALVAIVAKLDEFRGKSRFATWAYKFVVLEVASKLTRHVWRTRPTVFDNDNWEQLPDRFGFTPEESLEQRELLHAVRTAVETRLTPRQRCVFIAIVLKAIPLDVLVVELGSTRNALYKTLFDARRKVRAHLVADGYTEFE
jgi:RNA polymerase sigma-70 factor (ECF subfamily)